MGEITISRIRAGYHRVFTSTGVYCITRNGKIWFVEGRDLTNAGDVEVVTYLALTLRRCVEFIRGRTK